MKPCLKPNDSSVLYVSLNTFLIGASHHSRSYEPILSTYYSIYLPIALLNVSIKLNIISPSNFIEATAFSVEPFSEPYWVTYIVFSRQSWILFLALGNLTRIFLNPSL